MADQSRVSSSENKSNLDSQKKRLVDYPAARGYRITKVATGVRFGNKRYPETVASSVTREVCTPKRSREQDRLTRLGFTGYKTLLNNEGRDVKVVNGAENGIEDLLQNLISIFLLSALGFVGKEE